MGLLQEWARLLTPGGILVVDVAHPRRELGTLDIGHGTPRLLLRSCKTLRWCPSLNESAGGQHSFADTNPDTCGTSLAVTTDEH